MLRRDQRVYLKLMIDRSYPGLPVHSP
jgi:hypothetical protein